MYKTKANTHLLPLKIYQSQKFVYFSMSFCKWNSPLDQKEVRKLNLEGLSAKIED